MKEEQQQQQQLQQQRNTSQLKPKEKPLNNVVNEMSTNNMKKTVFIIRDSMIKKVHGYLLTNSIKHKYLVKVRPFLAAIANLQLASYLMYQRFLRESFISK